MAKDYLRLGQNGQKRPVRDYIAMTSGSLRGTTSLPSEEQDGWNPIVEWWRGITSSTIPGTMSGVGSALQAWNAARGDDYNKGFGKWLVDRSAAMDWRQPISSEEAFGENGMELSEWKEFIEWISGATGQGMGSILAMLAGRYAGGVVGGGLGAAGGAVGGAVAAGPAGALAGGAAGAAIGTTVGGLAGGTGVGYLLNTGETFSQLVEEGVDPKTAGKEARFWGGFMALLDRVGLEAILGKYGAKQFKGALISRAVKKGAVGFVTGAAGEGMTEGAQSATREILAANLTGDTNRDERLRRVVEDAIAGAATGGVFRFGAEVAREASGPSTPQPTPARPAPAEAAKPTKPHNIDDDADDGAEVIAKTLEEIKLTAGPAEIFDADGVKIEDVDVVAFEPGDGETTQDTLIVRVDGVRQERSWPLPGGQTIKSAKQAQDAEATQKFVSDVSAVVTNEKGGVATKLDTALRKKLTDQGFNTTEDVPADQREKFLSEFTKEAEQIKKDHIASNLFENEVTDLKDDFAEVGDGKGFEPADKKIRAALEIAEGDPIPTEHQQTYKNQMRAQLKRAKEKAKAAAGTGGGRGGAPGTGGTGTGTDGDGDKSGTATKPDAEWLKNVKQAPAPAAGRPEGQPIVGDIIPIARPKKKNVNSMLMVIEAGSASTSNVIDTDGTVGRKSEHYNQDLQNRDLLSESERNKIETVMGQSINPDMLVPGSSVGEGAPKLDATGQVISGNGRMLALMSAYIRGNAEAYRESIKKYANIEGFEQPVLVQVITDEMTEKELVDFARTTNVSSVASMDSAQRAKNLAKTLMERNIIKSYQGGDVLSGANRDFVDALLKHIPATERAAISDKKGILSSQGVGMIQDALVAAAYEGPNSERLLDNLINSIDKEQKTIAEVLKTVAGEWARMRHSLNAKDSDQDQDPTADLMEAVAAINWVKSEEAQGMSIQEKRAQPSMFGDPGAVSDPVNEIIKLFYSKDPWGEGVEQGTSPPLERSQKKVVESLSEIARDFDTYFNQRSPDAESPAAKLARGDYNRHTKKETTKKSNLLDTSTTTTLGTQPGKITFSEEGDSDHVAVMKGGEKIGSIVKTENPEHDPKDETSLPYYWHLTLYGPGSSTFGELNRAKAVASIDVLVEGKPGDEGRAIVIDGKRVGFVEKKKGFPKFYVAGERLKKRYQFIEKFMGSGYGTEVEIAAVIRNAEHLKRTRKEPAPEQEGPAKPTPTRKKAATAKKAAPRKAKPKAKPKAQAGITAIKRDALLETYRAIKEAAKRIVPNSLVAVSPTPELEYDLHGETHFAAGLYFPTRMIDEDTIDAAVEAAAPFQETDAEEARADAVMRGEAGLIQIAAMSRDPQASLRHEAIHALRDMGLISDREWAALTRAARKKKWIQKHKIRGFENYRHVTQDMELEEAVAFEFMAWYQKNQKLSPKSSDSIVTRAFKKIARIIRAIGDTLRDNRKVDRLFRDIESGRVGARAQGTAQAGATTQFAQAAPIESKEFKKWFRGSVVVDENKKPEVMYHSGSFNEQQDIPWSWMHFGTERAAVDRARAKREFVSTARIRFTRAYLSMKKPLRLEDHGAWSPTGIMKQIKDDTDIEISERDQRTYDQLSERWEKMHFIRRLIQKKGYDGIVYQNFVEDEGQDSYIAFEPTQVKSVRNRGTFSPSSPNILAQAAPIPFAQAEPPDSQAFKNWFRNSVVVDERDRPEVMYHGGTFREGRDIPRSWMHFGTERAAANRARVKTAQQEAENIEAFQAKDENGNEGWKWRTEFQEQPYDHVFDTEDHAKEAGSQYLRIQVALGASLVDEERIRDDITSVYLSIQNPYRFRDMEDWDPHKMLNAIINKRQIMVNEERVDAFHELYSDYEKLDLIERLLKEHGYDGIVYRNDFEDAGHDSYIVFKPTQVKSVRNKGRFSRQDPDIMAQAAPQPKIAFEKKSSRILLVRRGDDLIGKIVKEGRGDYAVYMQDKRQTDWDDPVPGQPGIWRHDGDPEGFQTLREAKQFASIFIEAEGEYYDKRIDVRMDGVFIGQLVHEGYGNYIFDSSIRDRYEGRSGFGVFDKSELDTQIQILRQAEHERRQESGGPAAPSIMAQAVTDRPSGVFSFGDKRSNQVTFEDGPAEAMADQTTYVIQDKKVVGQISLVESRVVLNIHHDESESPITLYDRGQAKQIVRGISKGRLNVKDRYGVVSQITMHKGDDGEISYVVTNTDTKKEYRAFDLDDAFRTSRIHLKVEDEIVKRREERRAKQAEKERREKEEETAVLEKFAEAARRIVPEGIDVQFIKKHFIEVDTPIGTVVAKGVAGSRRGRPLIQIAMYADNPASTLRHEAIHALRSMGFFTDKEWAAVTRAAKKGGWIEEYNLRDVEPYRTFHQDRLVEEAFARKYQEWFERNHKGGEGFLKPAGHVPPPDPKKLGVEPWRPDSEAQLPDSRPKSRDSILVRAYKKIVQLVKNLRKLFNKDDKQIVERLYQKIESGKVRRRSRRTGVLRKRQVGHLRGEFEVASPTDSPAFKRWFKNSVVRDRQGKPKTVFHHGTFDQQTDVPRGWMHFGTAGAAEDRALQQPVDAILESVYATQGENAEGQEGWFWATEEHGDQDEFSSPHRSEEDAIEAGRRELRSYAEDYVAQMRADAEYERDQLGWDVADEGQTTEVYLALQNPIRLDDMGEWKPDGIFDQIARKIDPTDAERKRFEGLDSDAKKLEEIVKLLKSRAYDGVVYRNAYEDAGSESYIVFDPNQVKSVENVGTFDPSKPSIMAQAAPAPHVDSKAFKRWFKNSWVVDTNKRPLRVFHHGSFREETDIPNSWMHFGTEAASIDRKWDKAKEDMLQSIEADYRAHPNELFGDDPNPKEGWMWQWEWDGETYQQTEPPFETKEEALRAGRSDLLGEIAEIVEESRRAAEGRDEFADQTVTPEGQTTEAYLSIQNPMLLPDLGQWKPKEIKNEISRTGLVDFSGWYRKFDNAEGNDAEYLDLIRRLLKRKGFDGIIYQNRFEGTAAARNEREGNYSFIVFDPAQIKSVRNQGTFDPQKPNIMAQAEPQPTEDGVFRSADEEIARRMDAARRPIGNVSSVYARAKESLKNFGQMWARVHRDTPRTQEFGLLHQVLRELKASPTVAERAVLKQLKLITKDLNQKQLRLFNDAVFMQSLAIDVQRELEIPYYGGDVDKWKQDMQQIEDLLDRPENKVVRQRLRQRRTYNQKIAKQMVDAGIISEKSLEDQDYITHRVLLYDLERQAITRREGGKTGAVADVKTPKYRARKGTALDISMNFLDVEASWMQKALVDLQIVETIKKIDESKYNVRKKLLTAIKRHNEGIVDEKFKAEMEESGLAKALRLERPMGFSEFAEYLAGLRDMEEKDAYEGVSKTVGMFRSKAPILDAMMDFRQKLAISFNAIQKVLQDVNPKDVPGPLRGALRGLARDPDEDPDALREAGYTEDPPWAFLAWLQTGALEKYSPQLASNAGAIFKTLSARQQFKKKVIVGKRNWIGNQNMERAIKDLTRKGYKEWEGYQAWQPDEGNLVFNAETIINQVIQKAERIVMQQLGEDPTIKAMFESDDWQDVADMFKGMQITGGPKYQMVLKDEVAGALLRFRDDHLVSDVNNVLQHLVKHWKVWNLLWWPRFVKYRIRNATGDIDRVTAAMGHRMPHVDVLQAGRDLYDFIFTDKPPAKDMETMQKYAVTDAGQSLELYKEHNQSFEEALNIKIARGEATGDPAHVDRALNRLWTFWQTPAETDSLRRKAGQFVRNRARATRQWNTLLEDVMRVAVFRRVRNHITRQRDAYREKHGGDDMPVTPQNIDRVMNAFGGYGAMLRDEVRGYDDWDSLAAEYSRSTVGDYGSVSIAGRFLRRNVFPYWSFQEINHRFYKRLVQNMIPDKHEKSTLTSEQKMEKGRMVLKLAATRTLYTVTKAVFWTGFIMAWNNLLFPEEEEELTDADKTRGHTILGKTDEGNIIMLPTTTSFQEWLRLFGLVDPDVYGAINYVTSGRGEWSDVAREVFAASVNTFGQMLTPLVKVPLEQLFGVETFPNITEPRRMESRTQHAFRTLALDVPVNMISSLDFAGKPLIHDHPTPPADYLLGQVFVDIRPADWAAYAKIRALAYHWKAEDEGGYRVDIGPRTPREQAYRNYRLSLRHKDPKKAKIWWDKMREAGARPNQIRQMQLRAEPLGMLSRLQRAQFLGQLTASERKALQRARRYWIEVYMSPPPPPS